MRDDIFVIWRDADKECSKSRGSDDLDQFVWKLNGCERRIQFTLEREKDRVLPFLDMSLKRDGNRLISKVYRKDTHTQRYINWRSNHPKNCLLGVLKGLIHRAHTLCDMREDLMDELDLLHGVFIADGYPRHLDEKTVKESWSTELMKSMFQQSNEETHEDDYRDVVHAPYVRIFRKITIRLE